MEENDDRTFTPLPIEEKLTPVFKDEQKYTDDNFVKALALSYKTTADKIRIERAGNLKIYYFDKLMIFKEYV